MDGTAVCVLTALCRGTEHARFAGPPTAARRAVAGRPIVPEREMGKEARELTKD